MMSYTIQRNPGKGTTARATKHTRSTTLPRPLPTSAPGLEPTPAHICRGTHPAHFHRDWARPCPHLHRDWARPCLICSRTWARLASTCISSGRDLLVLISLHACDSPVSVLLTSASVTWNRQQSRMTCPHGCKHVRSVLHVIRTMRTMPAMDGALLTRTCRRPFAGAMRARRSRNASASGMSSSPAWLHSRALSSAVGSTCSRVGGRLGAGRSPGADVSGVSPVPAQMWAG